MSSASLRSTIFCVFLFSLISCSQNRDTKFTQLSPSKTNIHFSNDVESTPEFNIQEYLYFYDGGGVASGDLNNDGLPDLFFVGNSVPNKLYLNKGNFEFEDITESAGISDNPNSWSTGVTMADVNGDHYLDIYVSKVNYLNKEGSNQLFINNGDLTFSEKAEEYGLDFEGYSTQAAFFDYDVDGDLDMYLLNHSFHSENTYGQAEELRKKKDPKAGDQLYRNDGNIFTNVTDEAGISSSALGYGLGIAVTDINRDGFPDVYIGNDFHENDYFYINNEDGTFTESLYGMMGHTSSSSMGNDAADINNDGFTDIVSLDMMPNDHKTTMISGGPDMVIVANAKEQFGFGANNNRNTFQINRGFTESGLPKFSEMAFASGVAKTEWSWSSLLADFDNNGFQDLYITNGLPKRPNDLDYVALLQQTRQKSSEEERDQKVYELIDMMEPVHRSNYLFKNNEDLTFTDVSNDWGFDTLSYSNGAVYTDLDNDGSLDIVVNNINNEAFVYKNQSAADSLHYLKVKLDGDQKNTFGIGSKVFAYQNGKLLYREMMPTRGFQSSVEAILHFGLGEQNSVDSLLVIWPDNRFQSLINITGDQTLTLSQSDADGKFDYNTFNHPEKEQLFTDVSDEAGINSKHNENSFNDFQRDPLMPYKLSTEGPALAVADVNGDGLDDYYLGGARGFAGKLFIQNKNGSFSESTKNDFQVDQRSEDVDAVFFDATGDGLPDLYVVSGGNEQSGESPELIDRLYINQGNEEMRKSINSVPEFSVNGSVVEVADFNGDGFPDLFVGGHTVPWKYGIGPQSFIFQNNGKGVFRNVTEQIAPELETIGNVTSAAWLFQQDKSLPDLVVAGEWMSVQYFENIDSKLVRKTDDYGLGNLSGLWQSLSVEDLDGNGFPDIILGNFGTNSRLEATAESPLKLYVNDFNDNGQTAPIISYRVDGVEHPIEQLDEILAQIPEVKQKVRSYRDYADKSLDELFEPAKLDSALQKEIQELRSVVLMNNGNGSFDKIPLPFEAQLFPVKAIHADDINGDSIPDLILGGNLYDVKPSMGGRQDAGFGLFLEGKGNGEFNPKMYKESGLFIDGQVRAIKPLKTGDASGHIIIARNNDSPQIFRINSPKN